MDGAGIALVAAAAGTGLVHTLIGPDHYLPFIMMSRARNWPLPKTLVITILCGLGHVLSSIVLGLIGVAAGLARSNIEGVEGMRGAIAAWGLIAFGIGYALWGLWRLRRGKTHTHGHVHGLGEHHAHEHAHVSDHSHVHADPARPANLTPWVLFVIFVLGPCEPLIPLFMYPAAKSNLALLGAVTLAFAAATILTMTAVVLGAATGLRRVRLGFAERYVHVIAGAVIAASGLAIQVLAL